MRLFPNTIYFDLSKQLTAQLLCADSEQSMLVSIFTGTLQEREICQQSIIDEIWENADGQLDAWGQLYLLTNVKKWFSHWGDCTR